MSNAHMISVYDHNVTFIGNWFMCRSNSSIRQELRSSLRLLRRLRLSVVAA